MSLQITKLSRISGTDLVKRIQNGIEISPKYVGTGSLSKAQREAKKFGYNILEYDNKLYVFINREWQDWTLTEEGVLSIIQDLSDYYEKN